MDRIETMQAFVAVVDAGSFVGAADRLNQSKAVVSKHIAQLEQTLGARLLHRTTRRLSLTPEGEAFLARSREMLTQWQEAADEVSHQVIQARGRLRVNAPVSYGMLVLAPLWPVFMEMHPQVLLDMTLSDRVADLVEEGFDLAIRIGALRDSTLVSRSLGRTRLVACASPTYLAQNGSPQEPEQLRQHRVLGYSLLSSGDVWSFTRLSDGQLHEVKISPVMLSNNGDVCREAAVQGQGITLQPDFLIRDDLVKGQLVEVLPGWHSRTLGIHAVYPSRRHLPVKVRLLIEYLQQRISM